MKTCSRCETDKPLTAYWKRAGTSDGLRAECKECRSAAQAKWLEKNGDRKKESDRHLYLKNKAARNKRSAAYYATNKAKCQADQKAWRELNSEKVTNYHRLKRINDGDRLRAKRRQHYAENKHLYIANVRRREADAILATPLWADFKKIKEFYAEAARLTLETGIRHEVDHIIPLRGKTVRGLHCEANLQILSKVENIQKSNKLMEL